MWGGIGSNILWVQQDRHLSCCRQRVGESRVSLVSWLVTCRQRWGKMRWLDQMLWSAPGRPSLTTSFLLVTSVIQLINSRSMPRTRCGEMTVEDYWRPDTPCSLFPLSEQFHRGTSQHAHVLLCFDLRSARPPVSGNAEAAPRADTRCSDDPIYHGDLRTLMTCVSITWTPLLEITMFLETPCSSCSDGLSSFSRETVYPCMRCEITMTNSIPQMEDIRRTTSAHPSRPY